MSKIPSGLRILYVDDERLALFSCEYTVKEIPEIQSANFFLSPSEALAFAQKNPLDVAFLDIDIGATSGFELYTQLREISPSLAVCFVTGNPRYMDADAQPIRAPYIFKPYTCADVVCALEALYQS